jgi:hypothetical protein
VRVPVPPHVKGVRPNTTPLRGCHETNPTNNTDNMNQTDLLSIA